MTFNARLARIVGLMTLVLTLVPATSAFARQQAPEWTRQISTVKNDMAGGVAVDQEGNAYLVGWTESPVQAGQFFSGDEAFVQQYHSDGSAGWNAQLTSDRFIQATGVAVGAS